jgi:hypothetical protein
MLRAFGLEIDDQLEFGRLHNRQGGGLTAFEDFAITRKTQPSPALPCVRCDKSALVQDAFGNLAE